ncbi:MAG TPA: IS110 family transposase [Candidatus Lokiarchaeia archaeon]|nr:IS110 family transposase [Candidatus Lokiarchaeia archaeon]
MDSDKFKFSEDWAAAQFACGIDVHKYQLAVAIYARDDAGQEFAKHNVFHNDQAGLEDLWRFAAKYRPTGFAMEATGVYHHALANFLAARQVDCGWPFEVVIANPADARGVIGRQKYDRVDALTIAKLYAAGILKSGSLVVPALEDLKAVFRAAARLERDRTALKNRIKKTLDRAGARPAGLDLNTEWARAFLYFLTDFPGTLGDAVARCAGNDSPIPEHQAKVVKNAAKFAPYAEVALSPTQQALVRQDLVELEFKTSRKALLAVQVDLMLMTRPGLRQVAECLATVPGISPFSAAWLLAEIGPVSRYPSARAFLAYCGCCPRIVESGGRIYSAHVTRRSNKYVRTIFYMAATVVCNLTREQSALKAYAQRVARDKGPKRRKLALMIVAAKIARVVFGIIQNPAPFSPDLARPTKAGMQGAGGTFCVADHKVLRKAKKCLERVGEILDDHVLNADMQRLSAALDDALHGKNCAVRGEPAI